MIPRERTALRTAISRCDHEVEIDMMRRGFMEQIIEEAPDREQEKGAVLPVLAVSALSHPVTRSMRTEDQALGWNTLCSVSIPSPKLGRVWVGAARLYREDWAGYRILAAAERAVLPGRSVQRCLKRTLLSAKDPGGMQLRLMVQTENPMTGK
jgi:hypothetical protein